MLRLFSLAFFMACGMTALHAQQVSMKINKRYLNFPISQKVDRKNLTFTAKGVDDLHVVARLTSGEPEYWVFKDMTAYRGKTLTLTFDGAPDALAKVFQADTICGQSQMYREKNRPQFHFTTRRGWINDPNGLVYAHGTYHLYYQHNPFEREWENMTWGHATSRDLIHWTEQPDALFPDRLGTMFSGSAVYDQDNTSGFGTKENPPLVYAYTADNAERETQCIAYSLDGGMTLKKYEENPVIDSRDKWPTKDTRDPRLFWYAPGNHWVLVLNEYDGHSIYNSTNLKDWTYQSHVKGFWECPDLFKLPVDGDKQNTRWVMYGASNTYMIGTFDGKTFTPEGGKYQFCSGTIYAAQTISHTPDGRRIQIGWGKQSPEGMPFNGLMLLPTELQLKTTRDGIRLVSMPVSEVKNLLHDKLSSREALSEEAATRLLSGVDTQGLYLKFTLHKQGHRTPAGLSLDGQKLLEWDSIYDLINGRPYSPQDPTSMEIAVEIYIDRTCVEVFIDHGLYSYSMERKAAGSPNGLRFLGSDSQIRNLEVKSVDSIWN